MDSIIRPKVMDDNLITFPSHGTVTAHVPCHVTYHTEREQNVIHIFEIHDPNLSIKFPTYRAL